MTGAIYTVELVVACCVCWRFRWMLMLFTIAWSSGVALPTMPEIAIRLLADGSPPPGA